MHSRPTLVAALLIALSTACVARPTQMTTDWKDPAAQTVHFRRTAAFFRGEDPTLRRQVEDRLASRLPNGVASYTLVPDQQLAAADTEAIRSALSGAGTDGVLVLRLVNVESQSAGVPTPAGATAGEDLWAYLRRTPRSALTPGQQTVVSMESRVYSMPAGKLLWVGHSRSFNPVSVRELVNMIVDAAVKEVRSQGLL
jgi:hypothetical protein